MTVSKSIITVYFYGSPANGYTIYPTDTRLLEKLKFKDSSSDDIDLSCYYDVKDGKFQLYYTEYGLTGVGNSSRSRGGRNFGILLQINGFGISDEGLLKIVDYLDEFVSVYLTKKINIFEEGQRPRHYEIQSFQRVGEKLDVAINTFSEHFLSDFNKNLQELHSNNESRVILVPSEKPKEENKELGRSWIVNKTEQDGTVHLGKMNNSKKEKQESTRKREADLGKMFKPILLVLFTLLLFLFIWQTYSVSTRFNQVEKELSELNKKLKISDKAVSSHQGIRPDRSQKRVKAGAKNIPAYVTVKAGEGLASVVDRFNQMYHTNVTQNMVLEWNKETIKISLEGSPIIQIDQKIYFPIEVSAN